MEAYSPLPAVRSVARIHSILVPRRESAKRLESTSFRPNRTPLPKQLEAGRIRRCSSPCQTVEHAFEDL
jgi:hypothetical protein